MWVSKWRAQAEQLASENAMLRDMLDDMAAQRDHYKEREQRAVNALLSLEQKPVIDQPNTEAAMNFVDKSFSFFKDEDGGEEVA